MAVASTTVGRCGVGVRGDAEVTVEAAATASIEVRSLVGELYGDAIEAAAARTLAAFGSPPVRLLVRDAGALPFALEARIEAALAAHLGAALPPVEPRAPRVWPEPRLWGTQLRGTQLRGTQLRRTRLYVPGDSPKLIPNAMLYGADTVILDLEDSVAPDAKLAARAMVRRALAALDWGAGEIAVRINAGALGREDLLAVAAGADALLVPKAEEPEELRELARLLDGIGSPARLLPIIESARGVLQAHEIASASPRVAAVALGLEDLTADLGVARTPGGEETAWAGGALVVACRAAGVSPLNSVHSAVDDAAATEAYARRSASMGFEGIGVIHPRQIAPAHRGFAPGAEETARAERIVAEYEAARGEGRGVLAVGGGMVDAPVYERARRTLERAGRTG